MHLGIHFTSAVMMVHYGAVGPSADTWDGSPDRAVGKLMVQMAYYLECKVNWYPCSFELQWFLVCALQGFIKFHVVPRCIMAVYRLRVVQSHNMAPIEVQRPYSISICKSFLQSVSRCVHGALIQPVLHFGCIRWSTSTG